MMHDDDYQLEIPIECPYCDDLVLHVESIVKDEYHVICIPCKAEGPAGGSPGEAIEKFNHRGKVLEREETLHRQRIKEFLKLQIKYDELKEINKKLIDN